MSRITQRGQGAPLSIQSGGSFPTSTDADLATLVGTRYDLSDGREVILVSNGSTATATPGQLMQDAAIVANHQNVVVSAVQNYSSNGNTPCKITVNLGATAATANQYQGGFLVINDATGEGQTLRIASHPAALASASLALTMEDSPNIALAVSTSEACLIAPHGKSVIQNPTTPTSVPVGIAFYPIPTSAYGFLLAKGIVSALSDASAPAVGFGIAPSVVTAGAIALATGSLPTIGFTLQSAVSTEHRTVYLNL